MGGTELGTGDPRATTSNGGSRPDSTATLGGRSRPDATPSTGGGTSAQDSSAPAPASLDSAPVGEATGSAGPTQ
jgi:hypothetical protein